MASSLLPPRNSIPFSPTRATTTSKTLALFFLPPRNPHRHHPNPIAVAAASSPPPPPPPPPPDDAADPVQLAFARAAAYKREKYKPRPPPPPPPPAEGLYKPKVSKWEDSLSDEDPPLDENLSEVEIIVGDSSKFKKNTPSTLLEQKNDDNMGSDDDTKLYKPKVSIQGGLRLEEQCSDAEIITGDPSKYEKTTRSIISEPKKDDNMENEVPTQRDLLLDGSKVDNIVGDHSKFGKITASTAIEPKKDDSMGEDDNAGLYNPKVSTQRDALVDEDFPEVEIIVADPSKFQKTTSIAFKSEKDVNTKNDDNPRLYQYKPKVTTWEDRLADEGFHKMETTVRDPNKLEKATPSTVIEPLKSNNMEKDDKTGLYTPKVSTWGMFPRPKNISKTYGGGRTIRPGEALETAEEKAAKEKRTKELIAAYQKSKEGGSIDERTKAECEKALKEGDVLMNRGSLKAALPYYEKVMKDMVFQSELHGLAALQWSICQDSLCRPGEARTMYKKLQSHPNFEISKKAKMFMFSFEAMDFMKVTGSSLSRRTGYETYFDAFVDRKDYYTYPEEEPTESGVNQLIPYLFFLVSPIFIVAFLAVRKAIQL